jgi:anaerobic dimethyl sulfoxide reductase subunit B (iron-sulfur subunit)
LFPSAEPSARRMPQLLRSDTHTMQLAFFLNQSRCSGCFTCVMACRQWHTPDCEAMNWRRVDTIEHGIFPNLKVSFLSLSCLHCQTPPCVSVCPTSAILKRKQDGIVLVDRDKCLGESACGRCKEACPYGIPQFHPGDDFRMGKCDFCHDRLDQGKHPICVDACPMRALDAGPLDELLKRYGHDAGAEGFTFSEESHPSVLLKGKK